MRGDYTKQDVLQNDNTPPDRYGPTLRIQFQKGFGLAVGVVAGRGLITYDWVADA